MKQFRRKYEPNLTRYAREVLARREWQNTKTEAEALAEQIRQAIREGTYESAKTQRQTIAAAAPVIEPGRTLSQIVALYDELRLTPDATKAKYGKDQDRGKLQCFCDTIVKGRRLGDRAMDTITMDDLIAFRSTLINRANSTWNKYRTVLGQLFRWAKWSGHIPTDPIATSSPDTVNLLRRKKAAQRRRRIDDLEWANLVEAARETRSENLAQILTALFETGCRSGEILALQWADVNLEQGQLYIRAEEVGASKTGHARQLDLSRPLYDLLVAMPRKDPAGQPLPRRAYVFGDPYGDRLGSIRKAFSTAVLRAHNIEPGWTEKGGFDAASRAALATIDLHVHDIRHEAACRWLESGWFDLAQISKRLGHTTIAQTATYLHAASGSIRQAQQGYDQQRTAARLAGKSPEFAGKSQANRQTALSTAMKPRLVKGRNALK